LIKAEGILAMYCPQCGSEYIDGVTECPDCRVALTDELPSKESRSAEGKMDDDIRYVPLVRTYSAKDIAFIHSVLGDTGIRYHIRGEGLTHLRPLADPAILMVEEEAVEDARELLKDLPLSFYPWAPDGGRSPEDEAARERDNDS
jgi:hypothetical protein